MTNEEIYRTMNMALTAVLREHKVFAVHEAVQKLVAQAYEEAAQIAESAKTGSYCETASDVREDLAGQIRALKDSLS